MSKMLTYFIQSGDGGNIKIGHTDDMSQRLATLQSMSGETLRVLGVLYSDSEAGLHMRFRADRLHNEWFSPSRNLIEFIRQHATPWSEPRSKLSPRAVFRMSDHVPPLHVLREQYDVGDNDISICDVKELPHVTQRALLFIGIATVRHLKSMTENDWSRLMNVRGFGMKRAHDERQRIRRPDSPRMMSPYLSRLIPRRRIARRGVLHLIPEFCQCLFCSVLSDLENQVSTEYDTKSDGDDIFYKIE